MAASPPRFWTGNHIFNGAGLVPSNDVTGQPVTALQDQQRSFFWRTEVGWQFTDNNNRLDFDVGGGELTAVIVNGYYPTGALVAVAITAAFEAATAPPVWGCNYNITATDKFNINQGSVFTLRTNTGTNKYRSAYRSLGYTESANLTGANSYTAPQVAYQSQHYLEVTLTVAQAAEGVTAISLIDATNYQGFQVGNGIVVQSNAAASWVTPTQQFVASTLGTTFSSRGYISSSTHRFWRLKVDDVSNPAGYFQAGLFWLGNYVTSPFCFSRNQTRKPRDFSSVMTSIPGQHTANLRRRRKELSLEVMEVLNATAETTLRTFFESINVGENFILDLDPSVAAGSPFAGFLYGFIPDTESESFVPADYWNFAFPFCEAL